MTSMDVALIEILILTVQHTGTLKIHTNTI